MPDSPITPAAITTAHHHIHPYIRRTPVIDIAGSDFNLPVDHMTFKLELLQHAGSFKARGAFTNMLMRSIPPVGVAAASGGNHGVAVAYAANRLGIPATIFIPTISSPAKISRIRELGANLIVGGDLYNDALLASIEYVERTHATSIHAFEQIETLWGQGTLGRELEEQAPDLDTVLVAVGGGGLIGGISAWYNGRVRIVGIEPELAPTLTLAMQAGKPVDAPAGGIAADSLAPRQVGSMMFTLAQQFISEVILVTDDEIRQAQAALWQSLRLVAEPGGATAFAALLSGRYQPQPGERIGVLICGGNSAAVDFTR